MSVELHQLNCQHPFGPGIHVIIPPDDREIMTALVTSLEMAQEIHEDYTNLKKLVTHDQAVVACRVYQGKSPWPHGFAYAVVALKINPDGTVDDKVVLLLVDPEWGAEGFRVAQMLQIAMKTQFKS
jgi:hypothetical protein